MHAVEYEDHSAVLPAFFGRDRPRYLKHKGGRLCPNWFSYPKDDNSRWLSVEELNEIIELVEMENSDAGTEAENRTASVARWTLDRHEF